MKIMVTGGDGYCGWPTSLHLSQLGHDVMILDNFSRRAISDSLGYQSLTQIHPLDERIKSWHEVTGRIIEFRQLDIAMDYAGLADAVQSFEPDCIVHLAAQRSAPYSMMDVESGNFTLGNNVLSTNHVLRAIEQIDRGIRLVNLGSIGVYGYEDRRFEIPEGKTVLKGVDGNNAIFTVRSQIPFTPTSLYHLSKSQISDLLNFYAQNFGINITDLYQGIVWGTQTPEIALSSKLSNRFDYDEIYGTVLNRFVVQAQSGIPLTVYGQGEQTRAFIHIRDTVHCIETAVKSGSPKSTDVEVIHQIAETRTVKSVAERVAALFGAQIQHVTNPRDEEEKHRYALASDKFRHLGLRQLRTLDDSLLDEIHDVADRHFDRIDKSSIAPKVLWGKTQQQPVGDLAAAKQISA